MRFPSSRPSRTLLALVVALVLCVPAWAQMRIIPAAAKRGELRPVAYPVVSINGEELRLAPGALIFDTNNRTILFGYLPESADVAYTVEPTGMVMRVYLLTPLERERLDQQNQ